MFGGNGLLLSVAKAYGTVWNDHCCVLRKRKREKIGVEVAVGRLSSLTMMVIVMRMSIYGYYLEGIKGKYMGGDRERRKKGPGKNIAVVKTTSMGY